MYGTSMSRRADLTVIDGALIALRRFWTAQERPTVLRRDVGKGVELSTVFVADAIDRAGRADGSATLAQVADCLDIASSTASRLVDRAVAAGMVRRTQHEDRRRRPVALTEAGQALVADSTVFRTQHLAQVMGPWPDRDVERYARLLSRFAEDSRRVGATPSAHPHPPGDTS